MGEFAERLHAMRVSAALPDGWLSAEFTGGSIVTVAFAPGAYHRATEREVARRLGQLARLLTARRSAEYFRVRSEVTGQPATREAPAIGRRDREYVAARDDLTAEGRSDGDHVRISVRGLRDWTVTIRPGTLRALTEDQFVAALGEAAAALVADQRDRLRDVAVAVYR